MTRALPSSWSRLSVVALLAIAAPLFAQPDPRQMAGIPRPVDDLPNGSVSVRVIRGAMTNNIADQTVELVVGSDVQTTKTDAQGRAQFDRLPAGVPLKARAVVDGERLESQEFPAPGQGGIRLLLVASGDAPGTPRPPVSPPVTGEVAIGGQSRIIIQPGEELITLYYLFEILNNSPAPVNPATPFAFDMPAGASRTGIMQGSSAAATVDGPRVQVNGPFPPGSTLVNIGAEIPVTGGAIELEQRFPAPLNEFAVIVRKVGETKVASTHIIEQREVSAEGGVFIAGNGAPVPAGQPLVLSITGMPHHSTAPRAVALALSLGILAVGVWAGTRPRNDQASRAAEQKRLIARREKLLAELVRIEREQREGTSAAPGRQAARREEILASLEHIYGALDDSEMDPRGPRPDPGHAAGVAA